MGGKIEVKSAPGKGAEFYFSLHFKKAEKIAAENEKDITNVDLSSKRILIVEDVEINRLIAADILSAAKVQIEEAEDGLAAVKKFEASAPGYYDLIYMDVQMPKMDGYEATKAIRALAREDAKTVPIIAMTANAYKEDVQRAKASGMNWHVAKPLDADAFVKTLVKFIG